MTISTLPKPDPQRRVWDLVLSIVLMAFAAVAGIAIGLIGATLAFAADSCADAVCSYDSITAGVLLATFGPPVAVVISIVTTIVVLVRRRLAFWIPLIGVAAGAIFWGIGAVIVTNGVPGAGL